MTHVGAVASALAATGLWALALAPTARGEDVPLPLTGKVTVKANGKRYVVVGKQTIPSGSLIRVEAGVKIAGLEGASLDVRGGFRVHGTQEGHVEISSVDFGPTVAPDNEVHLDEVDLTACRFTTPDGQSFSGGFTIENAIVTGGSFALRIKTGYLRVMDVQLKVPCSVEAVPDKGRPPEVAIRGGRIGDLALGGDASATIRGVHVDGRIDAKDFTDLVVDDCDLHQTIAFRQSAERSFAKLQLLKCNLHGGANIVLARPQGSGTKMEKVRVDKFWFGKADDTADVSDTAIAERIQDGADDPAVSVKAWWQNPQDRPH